MYELYNQELMMDWLYHLLLLELQRNAQLQYLSRLILLIQTHRHRHRRRRLC
jgi:hypothetical protein